VAEWEQLLTARGQAFDEQTVDRYTLVWSEPVPKADTLGLLDH
jgi:hypothetical protein